MSRILRVAKKTSDWPGDEYLVAACFAGYADVVQTHLSIPPDATEIEDSNDDGKDAVPDSRVDVGIPKVNQGSTGNQFGRGDDGHCVPEIPARGSAQSRLDKDRGMSDKATSNGGK